MIPAAQIFNVSRVIGAELFAAGPRGIWKMAASSRAQVLALYKSMLRESQKFSSYSYRTYAIRRIRDAFKEKKNVDDFHEIQTLIHSGKENLQVIQRQVTVGEMYATHKLIIESSSKP
ncbi:LYR motif-containing protein 4 [Bombina bombina]|uniref:LYR motif-containing protein 4 n=1 Tax=Bombina bombina TaxID=8345 RepID=UPI00235A9D0D|nr:LYR motif-containing protein 4 [Bombina bombina]